MRKSWPEKVRSFRFRFKRVWNFFLPWLPLPVRLSWGVWWLAENDVSGDAIFTKNFEEDEHHFVREFLKEGMTFLDVGAHHGFYTMIAAKCVGMNGRVLSFEPSPRERLRLLRHLRLNGLSKIVEIFPFALGAEEGQATLFVVNGRDDGCNSLRPPVVSEPTTKLTVSKKTLDSLLEERGIHRVDFIKLDVEGGELDFLRGATSCLGWQLRPVILAEIADSRTNPWGYAASAIYDYLADRNYQWFGIEDDGRLRLHPRTQHFGSNLVAFPQERILEANVHR